MKNISLSVSYPVGVFLFVAIGVISLMLQVLWQRELALLTGNTLYGVSLVVGGWMAGYGVGSLCVMWFARFLQRPIFFLSWLQVGVVCLALLFLPWFLWLKSVPSPWIYVAAFGSVFIPSLAWGMGLPLLGGVLGEKSISLLYGWNTLASALSVLLVDFVFLPLVGARNSLLFLVFVGLFVFLVCAWFSRQERILISSGETRFLVKRGRFYLFLFAFSGFTSLGYQLIYNRQLLYFTGNTIYCYGIITTVYIAGLAIGSLLYYRLYPRVRLILQETIGMGEWMIGIWHMLFPLLSLVVNTLLIGFKGTDLISLFLVRFLAPILLIGFPVLIFGFLYPAFLEIFHVESGGNVAEDTALAAGINTLGSVVGILVVAFVLIEWVGVSWSLRILSVMSGILAIFLMKKPIFKPLNVAMFGSLIVLGISAPVEDKIGRMAAQEFLGSELLYYKEGAHGTVSVTRHPEGIFHLKINGVGEVPTDYHSIRVFRFLGYVPFVFVPYATNTLVIALGGGITFGSVMEVPGVNATNVEICKDVLEAAQWFTNYNHNVVTKHRSRIVIDDGYTYLMRSGGRYDLLIADATHPSSGDSWVLYTREFYQMGFDKLVSWGVMVQWLPIHNLATRDLQVILKTFASVFPFVRLYFCNEYLVMIGGKKPLVLQEAGWKRLVSSSVIQADLRMVHLNWDSFSHLLVWESSDSSLWEADTPLSTHDLSPLQFSELRSRGKDTRIENIAFLLEKGKKSEKIKHILALHQAMFEKDYIKALKIAYDLPSRLRDSDWEYQQQRLERMFLISLRSSEGMQKAIDSSLVEKHEILQRLEVQDPLMIGTAKALILIEKEDYKTALFILEGLARRYQESWLTQLLMEVKEVEKSK